MEIKKVTGVIIGSKDYSESSQILDILTKEYGLIGVLAKGSKKYKSNLRSISGKFTFADFQIYYKEDGLSTLICADILNNLKSIKTDITKISYVAFLSDLTKQVIKQSKDFAIFDIFVAALLKIEEGYNPTMIISICELQYLEFLGVAPVLDHCISCGQIANIKTLSSDKGGLICENCFNDDYIISDKAIKLIKILNYVDISKISKIDVAPKTIFEIDNFLNRYYDKHTGLYLKSKDFLKTIKKIDNPSNFI